MELTCDRVDRSTTARRQVTKWCSSVTGAALQLAPGDEAQRQGPRRTNKRWGGGGTRTSKRGRGRDECVGGGRDRAGEDEREKEGRAVGSEAKD